MPNAMSGEEIELVDPNTPSWRKKEIRQNRSKKWVTKTGILFVCVILLFPLAFLIIFSYAKILRFIADVF